MIYINEDNADFYCSRLPEQMTEEQVVSLVDFYAETKSVKGLMFCTNVQRALFDSKAWEPLWEGYDPDGPDDQPFLQWLDPAERKLKMGSQGRLWPHNLLMLKQRGIDHFALWLERCRFHGIEGWLTMRMNDVHTNDRPESFWHSKLWKDRPNLWRVDYKFESWWDRAFDYSKAEVREHHMALIRELIDRYDMFGLELDWIRSIYHFAPGKEQAGCKILTQFVKDVRKLLNEAAKRRGHHIKLGVRIPENPKTGRRLGIDGITWIKESLVDQIVLSQWLSTIDFDCQADIWKDMATSHNINILQNFSTTVMPYSASWSTGGRLGETKELLKGAANAAYHKGASGIYLFNYCYYQTRKPEYLHELLSAIDSPNNTRNNSRRHPVTFREIYAPGEREDSVLPQRFDSFSGIGRYGATIALYPNVGSGLNKDQSATVILGFSQEDHESVNPVDLQLRANGVICEYTPDVPSPTEMPQLAGLHYGFIIPKGALHEGRNAVECSSKTFKGEIVWAEIYITQ